MAARLREIASGRRDALNVDPKLIKIEASFNPRQYTLYENREHLDELKRSIAHVGVLVPLLVRWDGEQAILIDGECRLRACLELIKEGIDIKTVPVLQESGDEAHRLLIAISANKGKPLTLLEAGGAYKRLLAFGWTVGDIGQKTGFSNRHVQDALDLIDAPREVKEMVRDGSVTPSLAKQVVKQKGDGAAKVLREKVDRAKAAGKKTAKREAKPSKSKVEAAVEANKLLECGDEMAVALEEFDDEVTQRLARRWNKLRGLD